MHFITYFFWFMLFCGKSAWNLQIFLPFSLVFQPSLLLHPQSNILLWLHTKNHCKFEEIFTVTELPYVAGKYRCQILLNFDTNLKIISTFKRIFWHWNDTSQRVVCVWTVQEAKRLLEYFLYLRAMHLLTFSLGFCVHLFYMREEENSAIYNRDVILLLLLLERYRENGMLQEKTPRNKGRTFTGV